MVVKHQHQQIQEKQKLLGETDDSRQGITDIALKHGLVTNYTSLIVARASAFEAAGIALTNAERTTRERDARNARAHSEIKSRQQDTQAPMFTQNRSYPTAGGGGGSMGFLMLIVLLGLGVIRLSLSVYDRVAGKKED